MTYWDAPSLTALCTAFLIFGAQTVALRFFARIRHKSSILADDWLSLLALVTTPPGSGNQSSRSDL